LTHEAAWTPRKRINSKPLAAQGPFVMNTEAQLAQAMRRYRSREMGSLEAYYRD